MKNLLFTIIAIFTVSVTVTAQVETVDGAPQAIRYQAIATSGTTPPAPVANQTIDVQMSILTGDDPVSPIVEWQETHSPTTDADGRFEVLIGTGTKTGGRRSNFEEISWDSTAHFLKVEMDISGSGVFTVMGTTQFLSVPYAFSSSVAANALFADTCLFALNTTSVCQCNLQQAYNLGNLITINATNRPVDIRNIGNLSMAFSSIVVGSGLGAAGRFLNGNPSNGAAALQSYTQSGSVSGRAGLFGVATGSSPAHGILSYNYGTGVALYGLGIFPNSRAGYFLNSHSANALDALYTESKGTGNAFRSINTRTGRAGLMSIKNPLGLSAANILELDGNSNVTGAATTGNVLLAYTNNQHTANRNVGRFLSFNVNNSSDVLYAESQGIGSAVVGIHSGISNTTPGNVLAMQSSTTNWFPPLWVQRLGPNGGVTGGACITAVMSGALQPWSDVVYAIGGQSVGGRAIYGVKANGFEDYAGYFYGNVCVTGDATVIGIKSALVKNSAGEAITTYAVESTEIWFEDWGFGTLVNGEVVINIEPEFLSLITTSEPYHVHIQLEGLCAGGVIVTDKTSSSFRVVHTPPGSSQQCNATFSYRIVAKRKGFENLRLATKDENTIASRQHLQSAFPEVVQDNDERTGRANAKADQLTIKYTASEQPPSEALPNVSPGTVPAEGETEQE